MHKELEELDVRVVIEKFEILDAREALKGSISRPFGATFQGSALVFGRPKVAVLLEALL